MARFLNYKVVLQKNNYSKFSFSSCPELPLLCYQPTIFPKSKTWSDLSTWKSQISWPNLYMKRLIAIPVTKARPSLEWSCCTKKRSLIMKFILNTCLLTTNLSLKSSWCEVSFIMIPLSHVMLCGSIEMGMNEVLLPGLV